MAIREVTEIPKSSRGQRVQPFTYTEKIRDDIKNAYDRHIPIFEFTEYDNPNYVTTYAKDIACRFITQQVYSPAMHNIKARVKKKFRRKLGKAVEYIRIQTPMTAEPAIKIIGVTVHDEKHVYGKIDFDYIANFEDIMVNRYCEYYSKPEVQTDLIRKKEREEARAEMQALREQARERQNR